MIRLLHELQERGIRLRLKGEELEFIGPKGAMTPELLRDLRAQKGELRNFLLVREGRKVDPSVDASACLLPLRTTGRRAPLFLAHPAGGMAFCYKDLARYLGHDQPLYGLSSPGWTGEPPRTIAEMASTYVGVCRTVQAKGPYRLGAWSLGGLTALEMARQLEADGQETDRLILLDPAAPPVPDMHSFVVRVLGQLVLAFQNLLGVVLPDADGLVASGDIERFFAAALSTVDGSRSPLATPELVHRCKRILLTHIEAFQAYQPAGPVQARRTLILFTEASRLDEHLPYFRARVDGPLEVQILEQPHALMVFEPHVQLVGERVGAALE